MRGLIVLCAAVATLAWSGVANAASLNLTVLVQGAGAVTNNYDTMACPNFAQNEAVLVGCGPWLFDTGFFGGAINLTLTAVPSATPAGHWRLAQWLGCDAVSVNTCTVSVPVLGARIAQVRAVFDDWVGPTITSISPVYSLSVDRGVSFSVNANETLSSLECRIDSNPVSPCHAVTALPEGSHSVRARGRDLSNNQGAESAPVTFRIVDTAITGGPAAGAPSNNPNPEFTFSTQAGNAFDCSLDGAAFAPCLSGIAYSGLVEGSHTFRVRAKDSGVPSWMDYFPAVRTWTVDLTAPETAFEVVNTAVNSRTASFSFSGSNGHSGFQCKLDGPSQAHDWASCTSARVYGDLADGSYSFAVRAVDEAGNADPSPPSVPWTIAATPPPPVVTPPPPPPPVTPKPKAAAKCTVPRVVGKSLRAAKVAIVKAKCRVGKVRKARSAKKKNVVTKQSRRPGTKVAVGTKIDLTVSLGARR